MTDRLKPLRVLTPEKQTQLFSEAHRVNMVKNGRDVTLFTLALQTGAKATELVSLNRADIIVHPDQVVDINFKWPFSRVKTLNPEASRQVLDFLASDSEDELLFPGWRGYRPDTSLTRQGFWFLTRYYGRLIDEPTLNPNTFRETYVYNSEITDPWSLTNDLGIQYEASRKLLNRRRITLP